MCTLPDCAIPYGLCHCGCGRLTPIVRHTNTRIGRVKGQPTRCLKGHRSIGANPRRKPRSFDEDVAYFWSRFDRPSPDACWLWQGKHTTNGYGKHHFQRRSHATHRLAYILTHGPIPDTMQVGHNCPGGDNKRCGNPGHMLLLSPSEHGKDRVRKGQTATGDKNWTRTHPEKLRYGKDHWTNQHPEQVARGERGGLAVLTAEKVRAIRRSYAAGGIRQLDLAEQYGVAESNIYAIVHHKTWKHIT